MASLNEIKDRISRAKASLIIENPFIASIVCSMPLEVDDTLNPPTLATDGEKVYVHPAWVEAHDQGQLKWALAHETWHNAFQHIVRTGPRDHKIWNIAGDVVINATLDSDTTLKHCRPKGVIWEPELFAQGKTTEGVYALLMKEQQQQQQQGGGQGQGQPGQGKGGGKDRQVWDDARECPGDPSQQAEMAAKWQVKVSQAAAAAKMCGKLTAEMERLVGQLLEPKVRWQDQLRHFFTKQSRIEYSFSRPNRRFVSQGLYLPSKQGFQMGDVVIAVDLSGSITKEELNEFAAEMQGIKVDCQPTTTHVLYFTDRIVKHDTFSYDEDLIIKPNGTGGTAFSPIFRFIEDHDLNPAATVVLTDLCCSDFGPAPDHPVIWASTTNRTAPWGEIINLRDRHA